MKLKSLLSLILLSFLFLKCLAQDNQMLCVGHNWSEQEANLKMKEFASTWNDKTSWEQRANAIKVQIKKGMQWDKMPEIKERTSRRPSCYGLPQYQLTTF